ncbi:uncharacterized protein PGTG_06904 [Puccinia graminis f. sp. tritici CRL 75-36-700-3]|uniref:Uncharacterized protein n=1 Tax=Puccinia graminis f. sp. tritici (strain CRL 75-36-700-3 / race SCCL) TaxID=418459 RepID=E3KAC6_PUCGT|nr:uncharacterized protein PGTG_06904 [Puccinia graminis f. sp. tritici CRL 75-36-700-3]EFP81283.2 hypothetical protein PGTG_06904 [Puccinia graminis f. sp. tritici CRL 75-36-700-3]
MPMLVQRLDCSSDELPTSIQEVDQEDIKKISTKNKTSFQPQLIRSQPIPTRLNIIIINIKFSLSLISLKPNPSLPIILTLIKQQQQQHPSLAIAILILISLSTLTILIDYWTQSQLYRLRYPWTLSPSKGSSPSTSSWKSLSEGYLGLPACDPFGEPGTVVLNTSFYHDASWVPFGPSCAPSPDYLSALRAIREVPINLPLSQREALIHRPIHPSSSSSKEQEQQEPQQTEFFDRSGFDLWGRPYPDLTFLRGKTILLKRNEH